MARKSKRPESAARHLASLQKLLTEFESEIVNPDIRHKVRSLIPSVMAIRDLGVALMPAPEDGDSARERILAYFRAYPLQILDGDELMVVSGIQDWPRRVRELRREFGWLINTGLTYKEMAADLKDEEAQAQLADMAELLGINPLKIKPDQYILASEHLDREAAHRWATANRIRKSKKSVKQKILEFLMENVGQPVQGEELRYLAKNKSEWARRVRELRTEDGWAVASRMSGRPDLPVGVYVLEHERQAVSHDRHIKDIVRVNVLDRDGHRCRFCGWDYPKRTPTDKRQFLELHHIQHHAKGGGNIETNLVTLCNVHHDAVHADPAFEEEVLRLIA